MRGRYNILKPFFSKPFCKMKNGSPGALFQLNQQCARRFVFLFYKIKPFQRKLVSKISNHFSIKPLSLWIFWCWFLNKIKRKLEKDHSHISRVKMIFFIQANNKIVGIKVDWFELGKSHRLRCRIFVEQWSMGWRGGGVAEATGPLY